MTLYHFGRQLPPAHAAHSKPVIAEIMIRLDNSIRKYKFFRLRERSYKTRPMGKLEAKIDKFLSDNGVNYHRQWPIKLGTRSRRQCRYIVSFYLPEANLMFDMASSESDMNLYDLSRRKELIWRCHEFPRQINAIIPINENMGWREVKKQLSLFIRK